MLCVILESFVELQRTGFVWDLVVYKEKLYREVEMVIFVPFVKCDTEEADLLCGKCTVRTANVKHVCVGTAIAQPTRLMILEQNTN